MRGFQAVALIVSAAWACVLADDRLAKLESVRKQKSDGVITFNSESFRKYVEGTPRPYSLILFISADSQLCPGCAKMRSALSQVSKEYVSLPSRSQAKNPVFFGVLKVSQSDSALLQDYGITHVPILYHIEAGSTPTYPSQLELNGPRSYPVEQAGAASNGIKVFVNRRTGSKLSVVRGDYDIPFATVVRQMLPLIGLSVAMIFGFAAFAGWLRNPWFWFVCVMVVYMYSVGGGHFSWIHNMPFATVDRHGRMQYIAGGSRNQYVAEGAFVAVLCTSLCAFIIAIIELPQVLPKNGAQTSVGMFFSIAALLCVTVLLTLYNVSLQGVSRETQYP